MSKEKLTKEEKEKSKQQKVEKKVEIKEKQKKAYNELNENYEQYRKNLKDKEYIKKQKVKKIKEKHDYKLALKELPVKMIKEVNKITWPKSGELGKKFASVLIFLILFAIFFYLADWGFQTLFSVLYIV